MSLLDTLPDLCTIQRRSRTNDRHGGNTEAPIVEKTNVSCWVQQLSATTMEAFAKRGINVSQKVYFASDPGVTERHEILITKMGDNVVANPIRLEVYAQAVPDADAGLGILYRVMVNDKTGKHN